MANAGKHIGHLSLRARGVGHAIRSQQGKTQTARYFDHRVITSFFFPIEMALQLGIDISGAKNIEQAIDCVWRFLIALKIGKRPIFATCQAHQTFRMRSQFIQGHGTLARFRVLWHTQFH